MIGYAALSITLILLCAVLAVPLAVFIDRWVGR